MPSCEHGTSPAIPSLQWDTPALPEPRRHWRYSKRCLHGFVLAAKPVALFGTPPEKGRSFSYLFSSAAVDNENTVRPSYRLRLRDSKKIKCRVVCQSRAALNARPPGLPRGGTITAIKFLLALGAACFQAPDETPRRTILDNLEETTCVVHLPLWWPGRGLPQPQGSSTTSMHCVNATKSEVHSKVGWRTLVSATIKLWNLQNALWAHKQVLEGNGSPASFQFQISVSRFFMVSFF